MARIHTPSRGHAFGPDQQRSVQRDPPILVTPGRTVRISAFWQHFLEMFAAMWVGMIAGTAVFLVITGQSSPRQAALLYPVAAVLGMALSMTVPMAGWMLYRGRGWRNAAEMAAAMLVPAIPFVILAGLHVVKGTTCCAYMALSTLAMLGLMFYRRDVYSMPMRPQRREHRGRSTAGHHALSGLAPASTPGTGRRTQDPRGERNCRGSLREGEIAMSKLARFGTVATVVGTLGIAGAEPALADSGNVGQQVRMCAHMMLPDDLKSDGSISMTMPDGTSMTFGTFGAMVTFMRSHPMCS